MISFLNKRNEHILGLFNQGINFMLRVLNTLYNLITPYIPHRGLRLVLSGYLLVCGLIKIGIRENFADDFVFYVLDIVLLFYVLYCVLLVLLDLWPEIPVLVYHFIVWNHYWFKIMENGNIVISIFFCSFLFFYIYKY